jgi:voltage-gated potassium channel
MSVQRRVWEILEAARPDDHASRVFDTLLLALITLNVAAVVAGTVQSVEQRWGGALLWFERFSVAVFSVEYLTRLWAVRSDERYPGALLGRLRYMLTPMALVDLLAVLPFYLPFLGLDMRFARAPRLLRLFRIAKLGRYVEALRLVASVARAKREELLLTVYVFGLMLLFAASLMYFVEHEAQPGVFSSIPATMWWAVTTLTTVGYGDEYPVTPAGRLLGALVAVLGIGLFALPTAILGSGFVEAVEARKQPRSCQHCGMPVSDARRP